MAEILEILKDILVLVKLVFFLIYSYFYILIRNLLPSHKTHKNVQGQVVLITGAGNYSINYFSKI